MKSLINYFIKYPAWATVLKILIMGFGIVAAFNLKSSFFPEAESKLVLVQITYPGSSPEEIEKGVIQKIEDNIKGIQGISRYTSSSRENVGAVTVEVLENYNVDDVLQDVKNAVDRINSFPAGMEPPVVFKNPTIEFAISFSIAGDLDIKTLKMYAREVEDDLRSTEGISQVVLSGFPDEEIAVYLNEDVMRTYSLTFDQVARAVRAANLDLSSGSIKTDEEEILIRLRGKNYYAEDLQDIVIKADPDGRVVRLRDIAEVENTWQEIPQRSYVNGKRSVVVTVNKILGEDILQITASVNKYVEEFNKKHDNAKATVLRDFTKSLRQRLDTLMSNGLMGTLLVLISLTIFLNFRLSFWVALSIPFSFAGMIIFANIFGVTINVFSLFGCILIVGILVDDGIVVAEQIYQNYEEGKRPFTAALEGTLQVLPSVVFAILTTVTFFIPFFFFEGNQGSNMKDMAFVVIFTILFSLFEAALILPSHLAHSKAIRGEKSESKIRKQLDKLLTYPRDFLYAKSLMFFLRNKIVALAMILFFTLVTIGGFAGGIIGLTFFPFLDFDNFEISIKMPAGTRENIVERYLDEIELAAWEVNEELKSKREDKEDVIIKIEKNLAQGASGAFGASTMGGSNQGVLKVILLDGEKRKLENFKILNMIREKVGDIPEAEEITWGAGSRFGKPISVPLISPNLNDIEKAKEEIKNQLNQMPELRDIVDNSPKGLREINIKLKNKAYLLGLTSSEIARQIRQGFFGEEVQRLQRGLDEVKVWVRYSKDFRSSIGNWENMRIRLQDGSEYPLGELITFDIERGAEVINHINGMREVTIDADLVDQYAEVPPLLQKVENEIMAPVLAKYPSVKTIESGQNRELKKFGRSVQTTMPIAFVMMFFLIVLSFRSFTQAFVVVALIPLGFIGAAWGHWFQGIPVNMMSAYGIVALIGIIVNDSIVFVNTMNGFLKDGFSFEESVFKTGINRFRPILLTTLTTVLGLLPLLAETSIQAQFLIPMAISVAYGLMFGTVAMLVFLPVYLVIMNRIRLYITWLWTGRKPLPKEVEPALIEQENIKKYSLENGDSN